jgi:hypothetical protein
MLNVEDIKVFGHEETSMPAANTEPVVKDVKYFLAHVASMVRYGSKPSREIAKNPSFSLVVPSRATRRMLIFLLISCLRTCPFGSRVSWLFGT